MLRTNAQAKRKFMDVNCMHAKPYCLNICYWPNDLMALYACIKNNLSIKVILINPLFGCFKEKDVDFQSDVHCIWGHWKGFTDSHSDIAYYRVGLGTTPLTDDIEPLINVGLRRGI